MTLPDAHATEYYVTTYRHALFERQQWHRFFEQATFGLIPDMFDNDLGYFDAQGLPKPHESFGDWIEEQNALPLWLTVRSEERRVAPPCTGGSPPWC